MRFTGEHRPMGNPRPPAPGTRTGTRQEGLDEPPELVGKQGLGHARSVTCLSGDPFAARRAPKAT